MDCTITQIIVHAAYVAQRNVLTSHSLLCAGRHSWSHVRAPCTNIGAVLGARYSLQKEKCSVLNSHRCLFSLIAGSIGGTSPNRAER